MAVAPLGTSLLPDAVGAPSALGEEPESRVRPATPSGAGHADLGVHAPLDTRIFRIVMQGIDGPDGLSVGAWDASYIIGMAGGAWIGATLMPDLDRSLEIVGGMFCVVCLLAMQFVVVCRALRPELADGGFLHKILTDTEVSEAARDAVDNLPRVFRTVQVISASWAVAIYATLLYNYGTAYMDEGHWDFLLSIAAYVPAFIAGLFRFASILTAVLATIEVLRDRAVALGLETSFVLATFDERPHEQPGQVRERDGSTRAQTADSILADAQKLGADLGKAQKTLHSGLVGFLAWCAACAIMFSFGPRMECAAVVCTLPDSFWVFMAAVVVFTPAFVIHRGPFRLTGQIDALNDLLAELRQRRVVSTSGVGNGVGGGSRPESGAAAVAPVTVALRGKREAERTGGPDTLAGDGDVPWAVYRPSRVQWLLTHDEDEMAEVVTTVSQAAGRQLERRQHAAAGSEDVDSGLHAGAAPLPVAQSETVDEPV